MENKRLSVNMGKTKVMICGKDLDTIQPFGQCPCSVCRRRVGRNSIFFTSCDAWAHKKCSGIKGRLVDTPDFKCCRCLGLACPIDGRRSFCPFRWEIKNQKYQNPFFLLEMEYPQMRVVILAPLQESVLLVESFMSYFPF